MAPAFSETPPELAGDLRRTVTELATNIGERNCYRPGTLPRAAGWIEAELQKAGAGADAAGTSPSRLVITRDWFTVQKPDRFLLQPPDKVESAKASEPWPPRVCNIIAELRGTTHPDEVVIVGAHYDSKVATRRWHDHYPLLPEQRGTPGANDNASGVACTLALARELSAQHFPRTLRFCFWVNEEPPFYQTAGPDSAMGSYVYAMRCKERGEKVVAMISPETMGCYSPQPHTKRDALGPLPSTIGLPATTDYIAFQSNLASSQLAQQCADVFSRHSRIAARVCALATPVKQMAWSDDWSFWQAGVSAFTVTDTAYLRSDNYHELSDTPDKLDYAPFADVTWGLHYVVEAIAMRQISP